MINKKLDFKLLEDTPVSEDYFQSHEKITDTIVEIISTQKGGKAISLTGSWGSGKSSVIEILKEKIKSINEYGLFVFDSWQHEGDALRKAFLDELIRFLVNNGWLDAKPTDTGMEFTNEELRRKYRYLQGRLKVEDTRTTPVLKSKGKELTFLLYLVPFGLLLSSVGLNGLKDSILYLIVLLFGVILFFAPFFMLYHSLQYKKTSKGREEDESSLFSLFFNRTINKVVTEKYEEPEPSSIEFEDFYRTLIKSTVHNNKKLVVVIDNLDRVDPKTALNLLSAIKPFIQCKFEKEIACFKNIWYIIPFDMDSLVRLWSKDDTADKVDFAHSFIDKIFQIKLRVPQIIMLNWKKFFATRIKEASQGYFDVEQILDIRNIFEIFFSSSTSENRRESSPTPRAIKLYINNFLTSIMLRSEIDYITHAIFIGIREFMQGNFKELQKSLLKIDELPEHSKLRPYLRDDLQKELAALYFNVSKEEALHILYGEKIKEAITNAEASILDNYKNITGIDEVLEYVIRDNAPDWAHNNPHILGYAAKFYSKNDNLLKIIYGHAKTIMALSQLDKMSGEGYGILIKRYHSVDPAFAEMVLKKVSSVGMKEAKENENEK